MGILNRILDMLRPEWKCSDVARRLGVVRELSPVKQLEALRWVLEHDPSYDVQIAAANRIATDSAVAKTLLKAYRDSLTPESLSTMVFLGKAVPSLACDVATFIASNIFFVMPGQVVQQSTAYQFALGKSFCINTMLAVYLNGPDPILQHGVSELSKAIESMDAILSEYGRSSFEIINAHNGQIVLVTGLTSAEEREILDDPYRLPRYIQARAERRAQRDRKVVFDLKSLRKSCADAVEKLGSH